MRIIRWIKLGRAFDELAQCPTDHSTAYWRGYAAGWNNIQAWVKDRAGIEKAYWR
jgi:hypothetical protein